jgi:hypothetical protein
MTVGPVVIIHANICRLAAVVVPFTETEVLGKITKRHSEDLRKESSRLEFKNRVGEQKARGEAVAYRSAEQGQVDAKGSNRR